MENFNVSDTVRLSEHFKKRLTRMQLRNKFPVPRDVMNDMNDMVVAQSIDATGTVVSVDVPSRTVVVDFSGTSISAKPPMIDKV